MYPLPLRVYSLHCGCNLVQAKFKHVMFHNCLELPPLHVAGSIDRAIKSLIHIADDTRAPPKDRQAG